MKRQSQMIVVGDEPFVTKASLRRRVQEIFLQGYGEVDSENARFLAELFDRHPSAAEKIGAGIARIRIARMQPWGKHGFEIERVDGTRVDISYLECLSPSTPKHWFRAACRSAVAEQKFAVRDRAFAKTAELVCPITGETISRETCHVHHNDPWPFETIVKAYIADRSIDLSAIVYVDGDGITTSSFADSALAQDFANFHRERAVLRVVSMRANTSILRRTR